MKYLVGLRCEGLMEDPHMYFSSPFDVIETTSKQEAKKYITPNINVTIFMVVLCVLLILKATLMTLMEIVLEMNVNVCYMN